MVNQNCLAHNGKNMTDKITNHSQQIREANPKEKCSANVDSVRLGKSSLFATSADSRKGHDLIKEELEKEIEEGRDFENVWNRQDIFIAKLAQHIATKQAMIKIIKDYPNYMIRKSDLLQKLGELK